MPLVRSDKNSELLSALQLQIEVWETEKAVLDAEIVSCGRKIAAYGVGIQKLTDMLSVKSTLGR